VTVAHIDFDLGTTSIPGDTTLHLYRSGVEITAAAVTVPAGSQRATLDCSYNIAPADTLQLQLSSDTVQTDTFAALVAEVWCIGDGGGGLVFSPGSPGGL
jgi:hypothetical protein